MKLNTKAKGTESIAFEQYLKKFLVGQDVVIEEVVNMYQMYRTGLNAPQRPAGSFLFLGPTGTGKTRTVELVAEALVGTPRSVIKIDCGEFQHSHEIAKLIGSPPGYLGHRETHPLLSQEVLNQYHSEKNKLSFVLFDEIEKASDTLWNLLLGVLDKATLTLGDNRRVDFSQTMIFMTSNLGSALMSNNIKQIGFSNPPKNIDTNITNKKVAVKSARSKFSPEFINRLDKVIVFQPISEEGLKQILKIELSIVQQRIFSASPDRYFVFEISDSANEYILKEGTDAKYGARHLKRAIKRLIIEPISNLIATEQVHVGDWIKIDYYDGEINFDLFKSNLSLLKMAELTTKFHNIDHTLRLSATVGTSNGSTQTKRKK